MKTPISTVLGVVLSLIFCLTGPKAGGAPEAAMLTPPTVSEKLQVPAGERLVAVFTAKGVQIYVCRAKQDDPAQCEWALKAPEAELFDREGKTAGKHGAGPVWEAKDGSKVFGELKVNVPSPDASAVAWLLLKAKKTEGEGIFRNVRSIQRLETVGGKAPATGCDPANVGKEVRVPYSATYYFYAGPA